MTSAMQVGHHEAIRDTGDISGYLIAARDGVLGHVSKANNATSTEMLVVDTGRWIFGKTVVLPIDVVQDIDHQSRVVTVGSSTEEIRSSPDYVAGHAPEGPQG